MEYTKDKFKKDVDILRNGHKNWVLYSELFGDDGKIMGIFDIMFDDLCNMVYSRFNNLEDAEDLIYALSTDHKFDHISDNKELIETYYTLDEVFDYLIK